MTHKKSLALILASCVFAGVWLLDACAPKPVILTPPTALKRLPVADYPRFRDNGGYHLLDHSIEQSLNYFHKLPPEQMLTYGPDQYPVSHIIRSLEAFRRWLQKQPTARQLNRMIRNRFRVYAAAGRVETKDVLFTGYYEPLLHGSLKESSGFPIPVHSRPSDLVAVDLSLFSSDLRGRRIVGQYTGRDVVPYPTRSQIRRHGQFNLLAPPIAWLKDEIDLFILQVQGSGRIRLENGQDLRIQFDESNGRPYRSIGRFLIDQGVISPQEMSMQAIRAYLKANPHSRDAILGHNPRYIFFRIAQKGPLGSLGVTITAMRSLAVDRSLLPSGALAFFNTQLPRVNNRGEIEQWLSYSGFALAQDAGSAIKGAGRIDLFMGHGPQAETAAGRLKHPGRLYFLVLNPTDHR